MASSWWPLVPIGSVAQGIYDGPHATPKKTAAGPVFLGISSLVGGRLDLSQSARLSEQDFVKWTRRVTPERGDLVFSYETRLGEAALIPSGLRCCLGRRMGLIRPDPSKLDSRYLLYAYLGPAFQETLRQHTVHGSTVDRILLTELPDFPLAVPPLDEQRRIARVLGALDDKIELNRKMNRTLEEMSQAIFKSWFIDFDGVPDSDMVDSDLGPIPKGWTCRPVSQVVNAVFDGPHATPKPSDAGPVFLGIKNLTGTGLDLSEVRHIAEKDWPRWTKRVVPAAGDIVFCYEARLGDFALLPPGLRCCLGRRMALVRPKAEGGNRHFLFHHFVGSPFQRFLRAHINPGSTVDRILLKDFPGYPVLAPPDERVARFEAVAAPLWSKIHNAQAQSQTLADLRNALLPKLISGELRVPVAEQVVEASL